MKKIFLMTIAIIFTLGLLVVNAQASNSKTVVVSCSIPPLLQMNIEENNIESQATEETTITGKLCVQQEKIEEVDSSQLMSETNQGDDIKLYSFYEK